MVELHHFKRAKQLKLSSPPSDSFVTAQDLFAFVYCIRDWVDTVPTVCRSGDMDNDSVCVLFPDVVYDIDDLWQAFSDQMAILYARWPIDVLSSSIDTQEAVRSTIEQGAGRYRIVQRTVSGLPACMLRSLCLQIRCADHEQADAIRSFLSSTDWETGAAVVAWDLHSFLEQEGVSCIWQNRCFCYGSVGKEVTSDDYLRALSFEQRVVLWKGALKDDLDHREFEWLYDSIHNDTLSDRILWELTLSAALQDLGYTVHVSEHETVLFDGSARRLYLSFDSPRYAQRALLKMLFPLGS